MEGLSRDPLGLGAEQMREIGYRTVDLIVDELTDAPVPAMRRGDSAQLQAALHHPPPATGRPWPELLTQLRTDVLGPMSRLAHPGYFAFVPASSTFPGALGDLVASALDIDVGSWMSAAGPSQVELTVLDWFRDWIGYPVGAAGILVSGGSAANITALACAREALVGAMTDRVVAYVSDQSHSSIARAARLLGFRPDQVRILPTDGDGRLRTDALLGTMDSDIAAGRQPLIVCATAGSTNTGAVDPLPELAAICRERGLWLHADGAYGGFAALTDRGRGALAGIELADSVTLDPHKWLYQPIECGAVLIREGRLLREAFTINPDRLTQDESDEVDFADRGLQLTRGARALKIWLSFQYYGLDAFRDAIGRSIRLADLAERRIRELAALELVAPASLGIVCFRRRFDGVGDEDRIAALGGELVRRFEGTGRGLVSSTQVAGRYAIRLCVLNHTSGPDDIEAVLEFFAEAQPAEQLAPHAAAPLSSEQHRSADIQGGWAQECAFDETTVRALPLFSGLREPELRLVMESARELTVAPGEEVIHRWQSTRHFYVIVDGRVEVRSDDVVLRELARGDFFGEVAALDWGAGYGYARTATVTARSRTRLLVLAPSAFGELLRRDDQVDGRVRAAARERLRRI